jgi:hypothetical protein
LKSIRNLREKANVKSIKRGSEGMLIDVVSLIRILIERGVRKAIK